MLLKMRMNSMTMAAMLLYKSCRHYSSPKKEKGVEMSKNLEGQRRGCRTGTREKGWGGRWAN